MLSTILLPLCCAPFTPLHSDLFRSGQKTKNIHEKEDGALRDGWSRCKHPCIFSTKTRICSVGRWTTQQIRIQAQFQGATFDEQTGKCSLLDTLWK